MAPPLLRTQKVPRCLPGTRTCVGCSSSSIDGYGTRMSSAWEVVAVTRLDGFPAFRAAGGVLMIRWLMNGGFEHHPRCGYFTHRTVDMLDASVEIHFLTHDSLCYSWYLPPPNNLCGLTIKMSPAFGGISILTATYCERRVFVIRLFRVSECHQQPIPGEECLTLTDFTVSGIGVFMCRRSACFGLTSGAWCRSERTFEAALGRRIHGMRRIHQPFSEPERMVLEFGMDPCGNDPSS